MSDVNPTYSAELELAVLCCMVLSEKAADEIGHTLQERDFYRPAHRLTFRAIKKLLKAGSPIDLLTVRETLKASDDLASVGGPSWINELDMHVPSSTNYAEYTERVLALSSLRQADEIGRNIIRFAQEGGEAAATSILGEAKALEERLGRSRIRDVEVDPRSIADKVLMQKRGGGLPSGFWSLDELHCNQHHGLARGQYTLFQAPTGKGKSTTMKSVLFPALDNGARGIVATFADLTAENWQYFAHRYAAGWVGTLEECQSDEERQRLLDGVDRVHSWDWTIYEASKSPGGRTIEGFRSWLLRDIEKNGVPGYVLMDYGQRIATTNAKAMENPTSRNQVVSEATMDLAKEVAESAFLVGCQVTPTAQDKDGKMQYHAKHATDWDENSALTLLCPRDSIEIPKNRFGTSEVSFTTKFDGARLVVLETSA